MDIQTKKLEAGWKNASGKLHADSNVAAFVDALCSGRFSFAREAWHTAQGETANELLIRAWDEKGQPIRRGAAIAAIVADGSFAAFNHVLAFITLDKVKAETGETLSINILPSVAAAPQFWMDLKPLLNGHRPENIIFEILEYETDNALDKNLIQDTSREGYRFALDDFTAEAKDWQRLDVFAPYLSFVKIDGPLVRAGLGGDPRLKDAIDRLHRDYAGLTIVAEFVETAAEAVRLYAMGITAVQGDHLPKSIYATVRPVAAPSDILKP